MGGKGFTRPEGNGCVISIDASPGASKTAVAGVNEWRGALQVKIAAPPRDGEANEELLRFLSEKLSVPRKELRILHGQRSSTKSIYVPLPEDIAIGLLTGD